MKLKSLLLFLLLLAPEFGVSQAVGFYPMVNSHFQFFSSTGVPLAAGKIYTYSAGSLTPQATYTDSTGLSQNSNPIILDATGSANIWFALQGYKIVVQDSFGNQQWTQDNLQPARLDAIITDPTGNASQTINGPLSLNGFNFSAANGTFSGTGSFTGLLTAGAGISTGASITPSVLNLDLGTRAFPFRNIYLGTVATNNVLFSYGSITAARTLTFPDASGTLLENGNGNTPLQLKRVAGCATAASLAAVCTTVVSWATAFADTNYTATCDGDVITSGVPINGGFTAKAAGSVTFQTVAGTSAAAQWTNLDCIAVHD